MAKCFDKKFCFFAFRVFRHSLSGTLAYLRVRLAGLPAKTDKLAVQTRRLTGRTGRLTVSPDRRPGEAERPTGKTGTAAGTSLPTIKIMLTSSRGLVLRTLKYKDDENIVDVYTEDEGMVSFLVRVSASRRAAVKSRLFRPMALLHVEWDRKPNARLARIKAARPDYIETSVPYDPYKTSIALFLAEFLHLALRENPPDRPLYAYLRASVVWLDLCQRSFANFHLVFLMRLSRFLGFYPNLDDYTPGDCFDLRNACFTSSPPLEHPDYLLPDEASRLTTLMRMNYETMHLFVMNRTERRRCLTLLNEYYRLHLPDFPVLKSLGVLQTLFDS